MHVLPGGRRALPYRHPCTIFFFIPYITVRGEVRKKGIFINLMSLILKMFKPLSSQQDIAYVLFS